MGKVLLRRVESRDLELMLAWRNNPEIYRYFTRQKETIPIENHVNWFENRDSKQRIDWMIDAVVKDRVLRVGSINVSRLHEKTPEVGVYIGLGYQRKGFAEAACKEVISFLEGSGYSKIQAGINEENTASINLFKNKLGFKDSQEVNEFGEKVFIKEISDNSGDSR